jgi:hypothetical protein
MAKQNSTTKQSSGGGYPFENEVVAYVLAHLLRRSSPFEPPGGIVEQVDVQRPATEWHLDDLVVTVRAHGTRHRLAFSVKSNTQISKSGFPSDFVRDAWEQLLHDSSPVFEARRDYLGLITVPAESGLKKAVFELLGFARSQSPSSLASQAGLPNRTNDTIRKLLRSAECPEDLATKHGVEKGSAGRLLRHILWVPLDFEDQSSVHRIQALQICQNLLRSGASDEAEALWLKIKEVADRLRRFGGGIDLGRLVDALRGHFELRDFPDHVADWERLSENTVSALRRVRSTIGGAVTLLRLPEHEEVDQAFVEHRAVLLLGASGSGKSVIAKEQAERAAAQGRALWLDSDRIRARTFTEWRAHLDLGHALGEIVRTTPAADALLVLDALDRLYNTAEFATVAEFVRAVRLDDESSPWRVLITCTPEAWNRVRGELVSHGSLPAALGMVTIGPPAGDELMAVWSTFPQLRALQARHHLAPVLFRPKVLDLLATRATAGDNLATVGESDLALWFWDREVAYGPHAALRAGAAREFARHLADKLVPDVSLSALAMAVGAANVPGIDELTEGRVFRRAEGRVAFDHDLYGDWVRVRHLEDVDKDGKLTEFLAPRLTSPVWHRALRLYGIHLLEKSKDLKPWISAFEAAGTFPAPAGVLAQDILLESTAFASANGTGLFRDGLWPLLAKGRGHLLERLLKRLFHTATIPNPAMVEAIVRQDPKLAIHAAAWARLPYPYDWFGILSLLHAHREEVPSRIRDLAARVADLWLRATSTQWPLRKEAAALAVTLGEAGLRDREERDCLFLDEEEDQQVYRAILASGHEEPEAVTQIVLEAAGRRVRRYKPPPPSEERLAELHEKRRNHAGWSFGWHSGPLPEPWPHGPACRVDGALQKVVFESDALQPLAKALPEVAREALLALLIEEPKHRRFDEDSLDAPFALEWPSWHPPFYTRGSFRSFLAAAETEAVTAILQLIGHATDRWVETGARYRARKRGCSPGEIETPVVPIQVEGKERDYIGNERVFGWSQQSPDHGGVLGSALAALEKHLYDRVDAGEDVTPLVQRLLAESRSLSIVGLLSVFGRRHPQYLHGPLRGLLVSPHALQWTLLGNATSGWELPLLPWFALVPEPLRVEYRAWHEMPHRKRKLRDLSIFLFLQDLELRPFFEDARKGLQAGLNPGGPYEGWALVEGLVAQLDPANYTEIAGDDGKAYIQYIPPENLLQSPTESEEALQTELHLMAVPLQCRQLLDKAEPVSMEIAQELWASAQRINTLGALSDLRAFSPANALAGVAAVLVQRGSEWLTEHSEGADWARRTLFDAAHEDRHDDGFFGDALRLDRLVFAAETLPALWADQPDGQEIRETAARLALHSSPEIVGTLASAVAERREYLGEDHGRLLRAILLRAGLEARTWQARRHARRDADEEHDEPGEDPIALLRDAVRTIELSFVERTLSPAVPGLDEIAPLWPLGERRLTRRTLHRLIDESLLIAAYRGTPDPRDQDDPWFPVWERIVIETITLPAPTDAEQAEDLNEPPGAWGKYLLRRVAGVVAGIDNPAASRRLWEPIVDLGASGSGWVTELSRHWGGYALFPGARRPVIESWMAMVDTAFANSRWNGGDGYAIHSHRTGELWRALLGFSDFGPDVWTEELRPRVQILRSRLAKWAESHLANSDNVRAFARFLTFPAAADLVFDGLIWLDRASQTLGDRFWGRHGGGKPWDEDVLSLLAHVWGPSREALRGNEPAFSAFRNLLQILVSRQHPPALELADRVGAVAP